GDIKQKHAAYFGEAKMEGYTNAGSLLPPRHRGPARAEDEVTAWPTPTSGTLGSAPIACPLLPPGSSSVSIAHPAYRGAPDATAHAAVQATMAFPRNAALLELADRYLGDLPEYVLTALGSSWGPGSPTPSTLWSS